MGRRAFTVIELVVVLALIFILALILMPALEEGRVKAIETKCLARVRQVGYSFTYYQNSHNGAWPVERRSVRPDHPEWPDPTASLAALFPAYAPQVYLFCCPSTSDAVSIDSSAHDFVNCSNWYVSPRGRATREEDEGKGAPRPPSYFYDAGSAKHPGIPANAATGRAVYGDSCRHGVWEGDERKGWLGKDNHEDGGNFLFVDKHVSWLPQRWEGIPDRLGSGSPFVSNPGVSLHPMVGKVTGPDPNVFQDDTDGADRVNDAHLSGMMWVNGEWMED